MIMAWIHTCQGRIFMVSLIDSLSYDNTESPTKVDPTLQAVEPARLISAYGKVCLFSIIYVIGTQLAIFNLIHL